MTAREQAVKYIRRIRNTHKQAYAGNYLVWLAESRHHGTDNPDYDGISYMAAQAVRDALHRILQVTP